MASQPTLPYANPSTQGNPGVPKKPSLFSSLSSALSPVLLPFLKLVQWSPFLSSVVISVAIAAIIAGTVARSYIRDRVVAYRRLAQNQNGIALLGHSYQLDIDNLTLSIEWEVLGCGTYGISTGLPGAVGEILEDVGCGILNRQVDVYFDGDPDPVFSYDPLKFPRASANSIVYMYSLTAFDVDHSVDFFNSDMAPFDAYSFDIFVFVIERGTNRSVPIATFAASEAPDNFIISSVDVEAASNYTYDSGTGTTTEEVDTRVASIVARRTLFARGLTMCFLLVNWALTIGSIYIMFTVVFRKGEIDPTVLLLPVTIILTIPALRSLYAGSPPFGIYIDTFGFVLQMITVAVCSMVLMYVVANKPQKRLLEQRTSGDDGKNQLLGEQSNVRDSAATK